MPSPPSARHSIVDEYRKFVPQIAYVLLAGWTLVADRLSDGRTIDGVTWLSVVVAIGQAVAVVRPSDALAKAGASLVVLIAQGLLSAWSDHTITPAEWAVIVGGVLAWAASAAVPNTPRPPSLQIAE